MDRYNYIITIDENGSPSLEHAWFGNKKGSQKKDHKYIDRILDKAGKWRYFYTKEEAKAYANKGKKVANSVAKEAKRFAKDFKKDPKKAVTNTFDRLDKAIDKVERRSEIMDDYDLADVKRNVRKAKSAVKATGRVIYEMAKEAVKPLDRKKKNTLNKIHEKFKDVTLGTISTLAGERDTYSSHKKPELAYQLTKGAVEFMSLLTPIWPAALGMEALDASEYNNSITGKVERWLDNPVAELHNKKYKDYAWKAATTTFDKPKEIASNVKKAWNERVKRDQAKAKSMKRRGVSPQTLLH